MKRPKTRMPSLWRSEKHKQFARELARFCLTVAASALVTLWLQKILHNNDRLNRPTRKLASQGPAEKPSRPAVPVGKMEDLYRRHLEEIVHTMKSQGGERVVRLRLPASVLRYQSNLASGPDGSSFHLESVADDAPFLAVAKNSQKFLDQMLVIYISPADLPSGWLDDSMPEPLPFSKAVLQQVLLVPDLTGDNAAYFSFEKRQDD